MKTAREEVFGPVLSVLTFDKEEEGIAMLNHISLGAAVVMGMATATKTLNTEKE